MQPFFFCWFFHKKQQINKNKGEEQPIPEYSLFDIGGFVYLQKRFEKLTLSGGVRFDNRYLDSKELLNGPDIKFAAFKKNFSNISGSIGAAYQAVILLHGNSILQEASGRLPFLNWPAMAPTKEPTTINMGNRA